MSTLAVDQITDNSGGSTAQINGLTPTPSNMMGRNKIINGKMEIAQRGTSFAPIGAGAYSLDRWLCGYVTSAAVTVSRQADAPSSNEFQYSLRAAVTTADTSIAAGDVFVVSQFIEGFNARDLIGRTFTLSFWVRSSKTGTHCVSFRNNSADRSFVTEYTINAANTWEYKSVPISGGLITAGGWDFTNLIGLRVDFCLAAGSTFQTTANAWQTGNFNATSNQVNCLDTIGNIFAITGVQLEVGSVATPFEHRPYGAELALCQRYYFRTASSVGLTLSVSNLYASAFRFPVTMRTAPTLDAGASFTVNSGNAGTPAISIATGSPATVDSVYIFNSANNWTATVATQLNAGFTAEL